MGHRGPQVLGHMLLALMRSLNIAYYYTLGREMQFVSDH